MVTVKFIPVPHNVITINITTTTTPIVTIATRPGGVGSERMFIQCRERPQTADCDLRAREGEGGGGGGIKKRGQSGQVKKQYYEIL
jgi:hypothetical protein